MLVRHPAFRKDLSQLARQYKGKDDFEDESLTQSHKDFLQKWKLIWFPWSVLLSKDAADNLNTFKLELAIMKEKTAWMASPDPLDGYLFYPAVLARDPGQDFYDDTGEPHPTLGPAEVLNFRVDLKYPVDVLVALLEGEIKKVLKRHHRVVETVRQRKGLPPLKKKRHRWDKTSFYIKVFDQASEGKTFREIARSLKQPASTVKSAFLIIRRSIFELAPIAKEKTESSQLIPSKKDVVLTNFDPDKHYIMCQTCRNAAATRILESIGFPSSPRMVKAAGGGSRSTSG